MIYLEKNKINDVVLTLSESYIGNYLFEFLWSGYTEDQPIYLWKTPVISNERFNLFEISDSDTGIIIGGTSGDINFRNGQWTYNIIGTTYSIDENNYLMIATSSSVIETGRMDVSGIDNSIDIRYQ